MYERSLRRHHLLHQTSVNSHVTLKFDFSSVLHIRGVGRADTYLRLNVTLTSVGVDNTSISRNLGQPQTSFMQSEI